MIRQRPKYSRMVSRPSQSLLGMQLCRFVLCVGSHRARVRSRFGRLGLLMFALRDFLFLVRTRITPVLDDPHGSSPIRYIWFRDVLRARHTSRYLNKFLKNHLFNGPMIQPRPRSLPTVCTVGSCVIWLYPHTEVIPDLVTTDLFRRHPVRQLS